MLIIVGERDRKIFMSLFMHAWSHGVATDDIISCMVLCMANPISISGYFFIV